MSSALVLPEGNPEAGECLGVSTLTGEFIRGSMDIRMASSAADRAVKIGSLKTISNIK